MAVTSKILTLVSMLLLGFSPYLLQQYQPYACRSRWVYAIVGNDTWKQCLSSCIGAKHRCFDCGRSTWQQTVEFSALLNGCSRNCCQVCVGVGNVRNYVGFRVSR